MLYRAENISVFVEVCNFRFKCPKKIPASRGLLAFKKSVR